MNQEDAWKLIKANSQCLEHRMKQNAKPNKCGFPGSFAHASKIFEVCYKLNELGYLFFTEARFRTGGRADVFIPELNVAVEVLESEEPWSIALKEKSYPCRIVALRTDEEFTEELIC